MADFGKYIEISKRLVAVLDYDGVPSAGHMRRLMKCCGLSRYLARRVLNGYVPRSAEAMLAIPEGLDVDVNWLLMGRSTIHPRTFRVYAQQINGYSEGEVDRMVKLIWASRAGHRKARNLVDLVVAGKMTLPGAAQFM